MLRRDPYDRDLAFLISVAVREPFVVYASERRRLEDLRARSGSARDRMLAAGARELLARA